MITQRVGQEIEHLVRCSAFADDVAPIELLGFIREMLHAYDLISMMPRP